MSRTLQSPLQIALRDLLVEERKAAELTQTDVAKRLKQHQSFVARAESGERRIDVVEFLEFAEAIGFDPADAIDSLAALKSPRKRKR